MALYESENVKNDNIIFGDFEGLTARTNSDANITVNVGSKNSSYPYIVNPSNKIVKITVNKRMFLGIELVSSGSGTYNFSVKKNNSVIFEFTRTNADSWGGCGGFALYADANDVIELTCDRSNYDFRMMGQITYRNRLI